MPYQLGATSLAHLEGVDPRLVRVVKLAIEITKQDFGVHEGLRSYNTQVEYVRRGVSRTLKSKHLKQPDGFSHAVDLVPYVGGALRGEWGAIWPITLAVREAARQVGVPLTWGGVWDCALADLPDNMAGLKVAVDNYCKRHPGPDFLDGPHYQLGEP